MPTVWVHKGDELRLSSAEDYGFFKWNLLYLFFHKLPIEVLGKEKAKEHK
jgi:hypothetical protein